MSHKYTHKITLLGISSFLFLGCSSTPDAEYVRVTQFAALEKKIEILEDDKTLFEKKYEELKAKIDTKENEKEDKDKKIFIVEKKLEKLQTDFIGIKEDFSNNKELLQTQMQEIDGILQKLEKVKDHYLSNPSSLFQKEETETLKNAPSEKIGEEEEKSGEKIINLEEEAQKIRSAQENKISTEEEKNTPEENSEKNTSSENKTIENIRVSFLEEKKNGEKDFLIFSQCKDDVCQKYLVEKNIFNKSAILPQEEGKEFLLSGDTKFLGEISDESYFSIVDNFRFKSADPLPEAGVSVLDTIESNMDNIMQ